MLSFKSGIQVLLLQEINACRWGRSHGKEAGTVWSWFDLKQWFYNKIWQLKYWVIWKI